MCGCKKECVCVCVCVNGGMIVSVSPKYDINA